MFLTWIPYWTAWEVQNTLDALVWSKEADVSNSKLKMVRYKEKVVVIVFSDKDPLFYGKFSWAVHIRSKFERWSVEMGITKQYGCSGCGFSRGEIEAEKNKLKLIKLPTHPPAFFARKIIHHHRLSIEKSSMRFVLHGFFSWSLA